MCTSLRLCIGTYVCMCVCMHECMVGCLQVCRYVGMDVRMFGLDAEVIYPSMYEFTYDCMPACVCTHGRMHVCMHACIYARMHVFVYVCMFGFTCARVYQFCVHVCIYV